MNDITSKSSESVKTTRDQISVPWCTTSVYQALFGRKMAWKFKDEPVPKEALQRMLDSAVWVPNHRLTEPWRFFVLRDESTTRNQVAALSYSLALDRSNNEARAQAARQKVLDPPSVIYVYCVPGPNEEVTRENYGAVCCAIQNICLAGVAEGVTVSWETGGPTRHPHLKETLGAEEDWIMVGMLSIGFAAEFTQSRRTPVSRFISWFE